MQDFLRVYWPFIVVALIGMFVAMRFVEPAPPRSVVFATGSADGAYFEYGQRYAALMAEHGVEVDILETAGTLENLQLLSTGDADIALLQGGLALPEDASEIETLGGLFFEPFWVFARTELSATDFSDLRAQRIAIGAEGSGSRQLALHVRREFGGNWGSDTNLTLSGQAAADALLAGDIDAASFTAGIEAPYVARLLREPSVRLVPFARARALARRAPSLAPVTLLRGVVDVGQNIPGEDVPMVAPVAQLGVDTELHPAIQSILIEAAYKIHGQPGLLAEPGAFPNGVQTDLPLSDEADRYYRDGPSALRRYFSFGMANFLERAWILLIPMLTLLVPLVRAAPPIYRWRVRRKIYIWYDDLRALEAEGRAAEDEGERAEVRDRISNLQAEIGELEVPLSYTDDLYRLRSHVAFVNQLLGNLDPKQTVDA